MHLQQEGRFRLPLAFSLLVGKPLKIYYHEKSILFYLRIARVHTHQCL